MPDLEEFCPKDSSHWREWLEENHQQKEAVWLIFYKTKSPKHNLSWSHAVDEALCFGWIDSVKKSIDDERFRQYFGKRKPKSNWSRINKQKVDALINQGLMKEAGHKSIEVAKENGSWTILDSVEDLIVPTDMKEALTQLQGAWEYFEALSNSNKKILLHWVISAKREETRQKRIQEIAENASRNLKPKQFR
jgi:uncharacterized protein YdeI (YjbR/CyaY-like superfamily)